MAFYSYINGRVRGKGCYQQDGCAFHWKMRSRFLCGECDTPTASKYGMCKLLEKEKRE